MITDESTTLPELLVARLTKAQLDEYLAELGEHAKALMILTRGFHVVSIEELAVGLLSDPKATAQLRYVRDNRPTIDTILRRGDEFELVRA